VRITATEFAIDTILLPKLALVLRKNSDLKVEFVVDYGLSNIVAEQYDAGVRSGEQVAKDMIAVRIGPDMRMAVVGSPAYFKSRSEPKKPQDLIGHSCINLRLPTHGSLYAWEFERGNRDFLQWDRAASQWRARRTWLGLRARRNGPRTHCRRPTQTRSSRLVSPLFRVSPLLSEPETSVGCFRRRGRGAALPVNICSQL
jgi:hypothetical protein